MNFWSRLSIALLLSTSSIQAAELVRLSNGYTLHSIRHEQVGDLTRVYLDETAFIDMPHLNISGYEADLSENIPNTPISIPTEAAVRNDRVPPALVSLGIAVTPKNATIRDHIEQAARRTGIDPDFIESVIRIESGYNTAAVSPKGARGLMQLMPSTAASLGVRDCLNPAANIDGGSRYLRDLLVRYDGDAIKALAAYNAGPERVEHYKGVPPFRETRNYVARVIEDFNRRKLVAPASSSVKEAKKTSAAHKPRVRYVGASEVPRSSLVKQQSHR